jgi:hypothetical protein
MVGRCGLEFSKDRNIWQGVVNTNRNNAECLRLNLIIYLKYQINFEPIK